MEDNSLTLAQVLEPRRRHPFFEYTPGLLHRDDLEDLMDDNFLRVVTVSRDLTNQKAKISTRRTTLKILTTAQQSLAIR